VIIADGGWPKRTPTRASPPRVRARGCR
jgi:hypothetical protein